MLSALLWDVDGTLAETERDGHRVAFNQAFAEQGLPWQWDIDRYGRLLRITGGRERLLAAMEEEADAPALPGEREALARALHQAKNRCYARSVEQGAIPLRPAVAALIGEACARDVRQAIVTTTSRANVEALLGRHLGPGWESRFAAVVCGEDVGRKKPDPEAYHCALAALRLPAIETLAIEDSSNGACAARLAGVPVLVTRSVYFTDDPIDAAVAIGPGLDTRAGWRPAPPSSALAHIALDDLIDWHARSELVSAAG